MKTTDSVARIWPMEGAAPSAPSDRCGGDGAPSNRRSAGFTLFELLVVVAVIAAATAVAVTGLRGGGQGAARDAAIGLLSSRVAEARGVATSRGTSARLFVHADPLQPERYLRYVVVCVPDGSGWRPIDGGSVLPGGVVVLPPVALPTTGPGAVCRPSDDWSRPSGGALRSTVLREYSTVGTEPPVLGTTAWLMVHFSPSGGTFGGDLVIAAGRPAAEATPVTVVCEQPDNVGGLSISLYGVATFARGRSEF